MCQRLDIIGLLLVLCLSVATHAADVRIFVRYEGKQTDGKKDATSDDTSSPRACMDDCVMNQGVTNLRSLDWSTRRVLRRNECECRSVNFEDESMKTSRDTDSYQYHATLTDVAAYSCRVARQDMEGESYCEKLAVGAAFSDSVIIVEEGTFPFSSGQFVTSQMQCTFLCLYDNTCNAYIIENISQGFPANCILIYNL